MGVEFYFDSVKHEVEFVNGLDEMYSAYKELQSIGCTLDYKKQLRKFLAASEKVARVYEYEETRVD